MRRKNREISVFSLAAIDLFCSGMGAVMVVMVLLMPYFRRTAPPAPPKLSQKSAAEPDLPSRPQTTGATIQVEDIDVVFVIDATMSMEEEINAIKAGLGSIAQVLRRLSDDARIGFVAYIDRETPWSSPLLPVNRDGAGDANLRALLELVGRVELVGNEDWPEDVYAGLQKATSFSWPKSTESRRQMIVVIGDAPTHPEHVGLSFEVARRWSAESSNRSIATLITGEHPEAPAYFQELARNGKGPYLRNQGDLIGSILDLLIVR